MRGAAAPFGGLVLAAAVGADVIGDAVVKVLSLGGCGGQTLLSVLEGVEKRVVEGYQQPLTLV